MIEDDRPTPPHGPAQGVPAPWERTRAVSPAPASPAPEPTAPEPTATAAPTDDSPRRSLDDAAEDKVSVAELLRRVGHRPGGRSRRRADEATAAPAGAATGPTGTPPAVEPAAAARGRRPAEVDDTTVLPTFRDEHAPLGGTPPPPVVGTPRRSPVAATPTGSEPELRPRPDPAEALPPAGDASSAPTRLQAKKSRRQHRVALAGKATVALVAVLVFAVTGAAWGVLRYVDAHQQTVQALDQGSTAVVEPEKQLGDENFLLIGSDSRAGSSGEIGAGTESQVGGARSDTAMVAHIPADRSRVVIVSFPRDLQVDLPACNRWDNDTATYSGEVVPAQQGAKLNTAYFEGGPQCITKVVQQLSGLNINHFLGVDFAGFQSMVDAVGGVQVCTEKPLEDTVLGTVLAQAGTQTIDGQQALDYVRARHVVGDPTSDYGRIQRQQRFLSSLLRASLSTNTLLNVSKLKNLVDAVTQSTFGEHVGVQELLEIARSMPALDAGRVTFITAPTTGEANSAGNEVLLDEPNAAVFQAIREGQPLPGEAAATTTPAAPTTTAAPPALLALAPADVSFVVRNAAGTAGLAAEVADELTAHGFVATTTNSYPANSTATVVRYSAGSEAAAATLASAVPGATLEAATGLGTAVELVVGSDVRGTTVAPTAAGTALPAVGTPAAPPLPDNLAVVNAGDATCT